VAVTQIYHAHYKNLTPWKGGGFGMFATIDRMERRPIRITVKSSDKQFFIDPRHVIYDSQKIENLQSLPSISVLNEWANFIAISDWVPDTTAATSDGYNFSPLHDKVSMLKPIDQDIDINDVKIENIKIEVYRMVFDKKADNLNLNLLSGSELEIQSEF